MGFHQLTKPLQNEGVPDPAISNWSAPQALVDSLEIIKDTHRVFELPVFDGASNSLIPVQGRNARLRGSLVEAHFALSHYCIKGKSDNKQAFDCFSAVLKQVVVLQTAPKPAADPYRHSKALYRPPVRYTADDDVK